MRFGSVCSGIEAASVAWQPLGWKAAWLAEIEPFPCSVLAHHYPDTPNLGDMTKFNDWPTDDKHAIDLLCGGTPCQSFSVAGLRKGLDDPRGNLMLTFGAIAAKYRPQWLVWENVPGVLSSNGGRDFGSFLGMLGQLGYGFAYRVLDAQYFGVAQRRRRVFVVGCFGDWRSAAAVLFERHSLQGHPAPRRQAGQVIAPTIRAGAANGGTGHGARSGDSKDDLIVPVARTLSARQSGGGGLGTDFELAGGLIAGKAAGSATQQDAESGLLVAGTLESSMGRTRGSGISPGTLCVATGQAGAEIGADMAPTLNCNHEAPYAVYQTTHTLRGEGFDASEDGTGRGTPLVPVAYRTAGDGAVFEEGDCTAPLTTGTDPCANILAFDTTQVTSAANRSNPKAGDPCHPLAAGMHAPGIAYTTKLHNTQSNQAGKIYEEYTVGLDRNSPPPALLTAMAVRRLTPMECERLQSFPDGYTNIPHRKKQAADGPRYKALGNSWCVNNVRWIGERIQAVAQINSAQAAAKDVAEMEVA